MIERLHHDERPLEHAIEFGYWTDPRTWVAGELVSASLLNVHLRDNLKAIGEWEPGDLKMSYKTDANATSTTLTEVSQGWYIANGATFSSATHPTLSTNIGGGSTLPDYRGRMFVAPGTRDGHAFARDEAGGEYDVTLAVGEMPSHTHSAGNYDASSHTHGSGNYQIGSDGTHVSKDNIASGNTIGVVSTITNKAVTGNSGNPNAAINVTGSSGNPNASTGSAHENMSPYLVGGMILIKNDNP